MLITIIIKVVTLIMIVNVEWYENNESNWYFNHEIHCNLTCNTLVHRKQHVNYDNNLRGKIISHKKLYSEVTNLTQLKVQLW